MNQAYEVSTVEVRAGLLRLETANDELCALRSSALYDAMIDAGQEDVLDALDTARRDARNLLRNPDASLDHLFRSIRKLVAANKAFVRAQTAQTHLMMTATIEQQTAVKRLNVALFIANTLLVWDEQ